MSRQGNAGLSLDNEQTEWCNTGYVVNASYVHYVWERGIDNARSLGPRWNLGNDGLYGVLGRPVFRPANSAFFVTKVNQKGDCYALAKCDHFVPETTRVKLDAIAVCVISHSWLFVSRDFFRRSPSFTRKAIKIVVLWLTSICSSLPRLCSGWSLMSFLGLQTRLQGTGELTLTPRVPGTLHRPTANPRTTRASLYVLMITLGP